MRLPTQLFFLFQRVQQLGGLKQIDLFEGGTVADFILDKDPLFASPDVITTTSCICIQQIYAHLHAAGADARSGDLSASFPRRN